MPMTNSATSPAPVSTSTPAAPSTSIDRVSVRARIRPLTAVRQREQGRVRLPNMVEVLVYPGDWVISVGEQVIDVASAKTFETRYELVIDGLTLDRTACVRIEETTGVGTTRSPLELEQAITRLAAISIGEVKIAFTPGQLDELQHRARKRGFTIEQELQRVIDRIKAEIFYRS